MGMVRNLQHYKNTVKSLFNRNIGCIEIDSHLDRRSDQRSSTETLDVLKSITAPAEYHHTGFNRNIGCIEIIHQPLLQQAQSLVQPKHWMY